MRQLSHTSEIGTRDRRITIKQAIVTRGATGASITTYQDVATVWAALDQPRAMGRSSSDEDDRDRQVVAESEVVWTIRYRSDIDLTEKYIIQYRNRVYDILSIDESGRNDLLILRTMIQSPNSVAI